jgi:hypothetical protein
MITAYYYHQFNIQPEANVVQHSIILRKLATAVAPIAGTPASFRLVVAQMEIQ